MYFGKTCGNLFTPQHNGNSPEWVESWNYLGVQVVRGNRFGCTVTDRIKKFYRCANAVFRIAGRSDDMTMLRLVESHCLPILTYGMEIVRLYDGQERRKIRYAYNSLYRQIFGYKQFESVTNLQISIGRPTWEMQIETQKAKFFACLATCNANSPVHVFSSIT